MRKGKLVIEGKTKIIRKAPGKPGKVVIESKDEITKNDDKAATRTMISKAVYATNTTCAVFSLLKQAGIPVAFDEQLTTTTFLAPACQMIPLEVIIRRYIVPASSYLKRRPDLAHTVSNAPHRFHKLEFELYQKTTGGQIKDFAGKLLGMTPKIDDDRYLDDPYISNPYGNRWELYQPKQPMWEAGAQLNIQINPHEILPSGVTVHQIEELARKTFLVLEGAWAQLGCRLIDFKIEFGVDKDGKLMVADVIDNDSWRLRTSKWKELSKQLFRDCADMADIADKYALVADLVQHFTIPEQALVVWSGSTNDDTPVIPRIAGVNVEVVAISGHKAPTKAIKRVEELLAAYPSGGVFLANVGMSNGLGPFLAARISWPVITIPVSADHTPHDIWSSLEMPSAVPNMTVKSSKNAVLAALNILASKNPAAYMERQYALELFDCN